MLWQFPCSSDGAVLASRLEPATPESSKGKDPDIFSQHPCRVDPA